MMGQRIGQCQNSIEKIAEQALVCSVSFKERTHVRFMVDKWLEW